MGPENPQCIPWGYYDTIFFWKYTYLYIVYNLSVHKKYNFTSYGPLKMRVFLFSFFFGGGGGMEGINNVHF